MKLIKRKNQKDSYYDEYVLNGYILSGTYVTTYLHTEHRPLFISLFIEGAGNRWLASFTMQRYNAIKRYERIVVYKSYKKDYEYEQLINFYKAGMLLNKL